MGAQKGSPKPPPKRPARNGLGPFRVGLGCHGADGLSTGRREEGPEARRCRRTGEMVICGMDFRWTEADKRLMGQALGLARRAAELGDEFGR